MNQPRLPRIGTIPAVLILLSLVLAACGGALGTAGAPGDAPAAVLP